MQVEGEDDDVRDSWYVTFSAAGKVSGGERQRRATAPVAGDRPPPGAPKSGARPHSCRRPKPRKGVERKLRAGDDTEAVHEQWTVPKFHSEEGFPEGLYDEACQILYLF
ncbi:unnamed protein product [Ostreobium quekettii]|uniref:Uncharacterized protein n=1 Tax=Ostreobium quekettii TaxID=121088 RepID=A0A8S1J636_9CHLO|nr:unnamed protein product [Ostreobium quekettii]|eukprot:evm.model.scf_1478.2 EVM.evm.TU.scf_1478.2   scf_1478:26224-27292(+)